MERLRLNVLELQPVYRQRRSKGRGPAGAVQQLDGWDGFDAWLSGLPDAVWPRGSRQAKLAVIAGSPDEVSGSADVLLRNMLAAIGLDMEREVWLTWVRKSAAPPSGDDCALLRQELALLAPSAVLLLGVAPEAVGAGAARGAGADPGDPPAESCWAIDALPDLLSTPARKQHAWQTLCRLRARILPSS